jgi:hypothetical protein
MPCSIVNLPGGGVAIVKHAAGRTKKCRFCEKSSTKLCDFVTGKTLGGANITCDAPICDRHATPIKTSPDADQLDYCPRHAK